MIHVLSAGACKGLFHALYPKRLKNGKLNGTFSAVGAIQEKLLAGAACELLVLTVPLLESLAKQGWVDASTITPIGTVATGIAMARLDNKLTNKSSDRLSNRSGGNSLIVQSGPDVTSTESLKGNLLAATAIHYPDPARSTAGIHFNKILTELGIFDSVKARCYHYPNGALATKALGENAEILGPLQIGCTQVSEILYTPTVRLVAQLPVPFELRTTYAAALTISGLESNRARRMLDDLTGKTTQALRLRSGFSG